MANTLTASSVCISTAATLCHSTLSGKTSTNWSGYRTTSHVLSVISAYFIYMMLAGAQTTYWKSCTGCQYSAVWHWRSLSCALRLTSCASLSSYHLFYSHMCHIDSRYCLPSISWLSHGPDCPVVKHCYVISKTAMSSRNLLSSLWLSAVTPWIWNSILINIHSTQYEVFLKPTENALHHASFNQLFPCFSSS